MSGPVLAIELSGSRCRAVLFSSDRRVLATAREELRPISPRKATIEFDPDEIWASTIASCRAVLVRGRVDPGSVTAIGIAADADTIVAWDRNTGAPIYNAIAAGDRRTDGQSRALREAGVEAVIRARTGLNLDPGRSATKIAWLLDNVAAARALAENGDLAVGGVGSFILWRMTEGRVHATDATTASSSLLFNIESQQWDPVLLDIFSVPEAILPAVFDNATYFGAVDAETFGGSGPIGVHGMAATAQAALMGQGGLPAGALSLTFSEAGCVAFASVARNAGRDGQAITAVRLGGRSSLAVVASNSAAADGYNWARNTFGLGDSVERADRLINAAKSDRHLHIVPPRLPAGAPWFHGVVPGLIHGLDTEMTMPDIVRAALESTAFAAYDLTTSIWTDGDNQNAAPPVRVSGGLAASNWAMQFLADMLGRPVERSAIGEAVALGVAWLAGFGAGDWPDVAAFAEGLSIDRRFEPGMVESHRVARVEGWHSAVRLAMSAETTDRRR